MTAVCNKCKKEKSNDQFQDKVKDKKYSTCFNCREQSRLWRKKNLENIERASKYNKYINMYYFLNHFRGPL